MNLILTDKSLADPRQYIRKVRHELDVALASLEMGFQVLSGGGRDPEGAKRVHQNGIKRILDLISAMDAVAPPQSRAEKNQSEAKGAHQ